MGYFTPFIAPKGRDGGVDILAYSDPLGTVAPRIVVQVKHRQQKATVQEIRELSGLLQRDGDTGLFVSSGGFTTEAEREVKGSRQHIENMDLEKFIGFLENPLRQHGRERQGITSITKYYVLGSYAILLMASRE